MDSRFSSNQSLFSAAKSALTCEGGWFKRVLLLCLIGFIPIYGLIFVTGYIYEWAAGIINHTELPFVRKINWKRTFLAGLAPFIVGIIIYGVFTEISLSTRDVGIPFFGFILTFLKVAITVIFTGLCLRQTVYRRFSELWSVSSILSVCLEDMSGFLSCIVLSFIISFLTSIVMVILFLVILIFGFASVADPQIILNVLKGDLSHLLSIVVTLMIMGLITAVIVSPVLVITNALIVALVAVWIARSDISADRKFYAPAITDGNANSCTTDTYEVDNG